MAEVERVLGDIGAEHIPQVLVYNKLDALEETQQPRALVDAIERHGVRVPRVFVSALNGLGLAELRHTIVAAMTGSGDVVREGGDAGDTIQPDEPRFDSSAEPPDDSAQRSGTF